MASAFETILESTAPTFMGFQGEDISYTPQGGVAKTIKAIVQRETRPRVSMNSQELDHDEMQVQIRGDSDTLGETTPKEFGEEGNTGDSFTVSGETWYVAELLNRKPVGGWFTLRVKDKKVSDAAA